MTEPGRSARPEVAIIGAGPAGLTAARRLAGGGAQPTVYESDRVVGGISRTVEHKGYRFDIGGHRFFTRVAAVEAVWHDVLGDDLLRRRRMSRILYRGRLFHYPLRPANALFGLGPVETLRILASYVRAHLLPIRDERSFEDWVVNRFGRRLFEIFFETYTEKVWGTPCSRISAEWAAQRIRGLSLKTAVLDALRGKSGDPDAIRTLVDAFYYPRLGPGMMWEKVAAQLAADGHPVELGRRVTRLHTGNGGIRRLDFVHDGQAHSRETEHVISSMPIRELILALRPAPPAEVLAAAEALEYRDFLTVAVMLDRPGLFEDNWVYVHDPSVRVGRIQNFGNWSPDMVPDESTTCLGLEYFCFEDDDLWAMEDAALGELATRELATLALVGGARVLGTAVVRMPKAYPVYDDGYADALAVIRGYLDGFANLQLVGRNGMHRYNNQDHSMLTAMLAADNVLGASHDLWSVNAQHEYHEDIGAGSEALAADVAALASTQPRVPGTVRDRSST